MKLFFIKYGLSLLCYISCCLFAKLNSGIELTRSIIKLRELNLFLIYIFKRRQNYYQSTLNHLIDGPIEHELSHPHETSCLIEYVRYVLHDDWIQLIQLLSEWFPPVIRQVFTEWVYYLQVVYAHYLKSTHITYIECLRMKRQVGWCFRRFWWRSRWRDCEWREGSFAGSR